MTARRSPAVSTDLAVRHAVFGDIRTRVLERPGSGPPFVLLHGFSDSADTWRPLLREMGRWDREALAVDLPHFGRAERPRGPEKLLDTFDRFTVDLIGGADRGEGVVLVGSSLGGLIALRAAQNPSLPIRAVVAIGPAGLGLQPWVGAVHRAAALVGLASWTPLPNGTARRVIGEAYARLSVRKPLEQDIRTRYASHFERGDLGRVLRLGRRLLTEATAPGALDLAAVRPPVTLIWGRHDALCPSTGADLVLEALPDTEMLLLPDAGHCAHLDEPEQVAQVLADIT